MNNRNLKLIIALAIFSTVVLLVGIGIKNLIDADLRGQRSGPPAKGQDREVSDSLLLGDAKLYSEIEEITFVRFPKHEYSHHVFNRFAFDYIGFAKTRLTSPEVKDLTTAMKEIKTVSETQSINKDVRTQESYKLFLECADADRTASKNGLTGALCFKMKGARLGFLFVSAIESGTFFEAAFQKPTLFGVLHRSIPAVNNAATRAHVQTIPVLFPNDDDQRANENASREFGPAYDKCTDFILNSAKIRKVFGEDLKVRLALSDNQLSSFGDSCISLTYKVTGRDKEGAAKVDWNAHDTPQGDFVVNGEFFRNFGQN